MTKSNEENILQYYNRNTKRFYYCLTKKNLGEKKT